MKAKNIAFSVVTSASLLLAGCGKKFDELVKDPNRPTSSTASLVLNSVLWDYYQSPWSSAMRWNQFNCCNYNYYGTQEYNWTGVSYGFYNTLKNIQKMEEEAKRVGLPDINSYSSLGKFFKAHFFYDLSMRVGDIPMNEALLGLGNQVPKYDSQKDVLTQALKWLEEANSELGGLASKGDNFLAGDYYYGNSLVNWQRATNALRIRILVQLSKKEADTDLAIKQKFAAILNSPAANPLFASMDDNLQFVYNNSFNKYPLNPDNYGFDATRYNMSATYLNKLTELKDPRTFVTAEPAPKQIAAGKLPSDFSAYLGASSGEDLADMSTKANNGDYSWFNRKRYYSTYTAENCIQLGYPEMCFNIAEAINRGWVAGDAEEWYKKGIHASLSFYGIIEGVNTFYYQRAGGNEKDNISYTVNFNWLSYYEQAMVKYAGNTADGLKQILQQKYLAFYQNSGWEAYYNWRRTGVPTFLTGPGTANSTRIPKRFLYPSSENTTNAANVAAAIQSQYGGKDDINAEMWIIK